METKVLLLVPRINRASPRHGDTPLPPTSQMSKARTAHGPSAGRSGSRGQFRSFLPSSCCPPFHPTQVTLFPLLILLSERSPLFSPSRLFVLTKNFDDHSTSFAALAEPDQPNLASVSPDRRREAGYRSAWANVIDPVTRSELFKSEEQTSTAALSQVSCRLECPSTCHLTTFLSVDCTSSEPALNNIFISSLFGS